MSNETKRDVFEDLATAYWAYAADALEERGYMRADAIAMGRKNAYRARYAAALPDDMPVIPKVVGEYIKNLCKYHRDLVDVFGMLRDLGITRTEPTGVLVWVTHNIDTFARAWVLGVWCIDETGKVVKL